MSSSATSIASSINLSSFGLGSGLNDSSIVSQLVAIETAPLTALQTTSTNITSASTTISAFSKTLSSLQAAANALADPTQWNAYAATSSASQVVATTGEGAAAGNHTVSVSQVAQAQTTFSDAQSSSTSALGMSGTLGITIGSSTVNVNLTSDESLTDVASAISTSGAGVSASVIYDGSRYRLEVQGNSTGAASAVTFGESGFSLGLSTAANTYQSATDAKATVDGIAVTSATNQISGAIPGVTLALTGVTSGAATVDVAASSSSVSTQIQAFVTAYNSVVSTGHTDAGYASTTATNPILAGDRGIEASLTQLSRLVTGTVAGTDSALNTLASVGVTVGSDGTLAFDQTKLTRALQSGPTGVEKLFVSAPGEGMTGIMQTFSTTIDDLANDPGSALQGESTAFQTQSTHLSTQITAMQTRITAYQTLLQSEFSTTDSEVNTERTLFTDVGGSGTFM